MPMMPGGQFVPPEAMSAGSGAMGMPGVGAPAQAGLDPQSAAGPGMGGAATAEGIAASTTPEEQPQQPAPSDPMAGQQAAGAWMPSVGGQMLYPDGMGPISGQAPKIAAHSGLLSSSRLRGLGTPMVAQRPLLTQLACLLGS